MSQAEPDAELKNAPVSNPEATKQRQGSLTAGVALVWLVGFLLFFYSFTLPNSNPSVSRMEVWQQLPELLLANLESDVAEQGLASSWSNFPQRYDLLGVAAVILAGAWGLGQLLLRCLRLPLERFCAERTFFAFALGLSGLSLLTLGCGLAGQLSRTFFGGVIVCSIVVEIVLRLIAFIQNRQSNTDQHVPENRQRNSSRFLLPTLCLAIITPFLMAMLLGAMLPSTDFDVREYHLQGPKEFFQQGRVTLLPHNVYTSFPFLTEMLTLLGMVLSNDWYRGALAGKVVLMSFAPLTALGLYAAGKRWFNPTVGWAAALIFLTTPWIYRISIIAYAEGGLTFYLFSSLLAVMIAVETIPQNKDTFRTILLAGLLSGSAMACKYPGVLQVVIPLGLALCLIPFLNTSAFTERLQSTAKMGSVFALGVLITVGPWLLKNTIETGNPVYPLLYSVFGGDDWDADLNARWKAGHSSSSDKYTLNWLGTNLVDVTAKSDWLSSLLFGLAPLAFFVRRNRRIVQSLWIYLGFLFFAWWFFTHRIDRFWMPMIPVVSLLAGIGFTWHSSTLWKYTCGTIVFFAVLFNLGFITTGLCGFNAYLSDLNEARRVAEATAPGIDYLNKHLPENSKVLCIGEAQVFDARFPLIYNTVFDNSIFEEWCKTESGTLRSFDEILTQFHEEGITHIFINWQEILRYRAPGSYGYTDFVKPEVFLKLQNNGVLGPASPVGYREMESLDTKENVEIDSWGKQLIIKYNNKRMIITGELYPVTGRKTD